MNTNAEIVNLKEMLDNSSTKFGDRTLYEIDDRIITYKEFKHEVDCLGTALIGRGLKNKRIAVIGANSYKWELAYLSIVCGTGVVVPLDKSLPENELESLIQRSEVEAIFCDEKYEEVLEKIKSKKDNNLKTIILMQSCLNSKALLQDDLIKQGEESIKQGSYEYLNAKIDENKMSILLFTSGTTSKSKAVMLSHKNICSNIKSVTETLDINENDVFLSFLPLHHVFECTVGFLYPISLGAKIVFCRGIKHIVEDLRNNHVSIFMCVPAVYENIYKNFRNKFKKDGYLELLEKLENVAEKCPMNERKIIFNQIHEKLGGNIKMLISGAAALDPEIEKGYRKWGINLLQGYGLTEASPVISIETEENYSLSSIGKAISGVQAKIINENEEGMGELVVKGDNVMLGYLNDDEATNKVLVDGWLRTGDLAKIDDEGFIYICGRKKSVIVLKNGKNIFPEEMEKLVNNIDGVKESLIFGKITNKSRDDIKLNVEIVFDKTEVQNIYNVSTESEIYEKFHEKIKQVNNIMPSYKAIKGIVFSEEPLIKTSTNKIKRDENIARINNVSKL